MFDIKCDACGEVLIIDEFATAKSYREDMNYLVRDADEIVEDSIQQYLVYKCLGCGKIYKFTYKDWEKKYRLKIAWNVMEARKQEMFSKEINPEIIDPDNGLEYCGQCSGYSGDGYCLVDVIKQCTIRKNK